MTNMQKQILTAIASLVFLSGCGAKNEEAASMAPSTTVATVSASAPPPALQLQTNEIKLQTDAAGQDPITGEKVYKSTCSICHRSGMGGAPRIGSKDDWEPRLAQGKEVLYDRAIHGYRGKKGNMPARGSNVRLSDGEVRAAVDYMVAHAIPAWSWGDK